MLLLFAALACKQPVTVDREVNAAWSADGSEVLIVHSLYDTRAPDEPHFNAPKAHEWRIELELADAGLGARESLVGWDELGDQAGGVGYEPMFWLSEQRKMVGSEYAMPFVHDVDSGEHLEIQPSDDVLDELFGPHARAAAPRGAVPSPDGSLIGIPLSAPVETGDFALDVYSAIAFYDLDGEYQGGAQIPYPDLGIDVRLYGADPTNAWVWYFLWQADSSAVYAIDGRAAFSVTTAGQITEVTEIPEYAVPTRGGTVNDAGEALTGGPSTHDGNETQIVIEPLTGWVPFDLIELIPHGTEDYSI